MIFDPDPIDVHVGSRIRTRRRYLGLSQTQLAEHCKITFQQIQKYERGANRVSASMLVKISRCLAVTPGFWFDALPEFAAGPGTPSNAEAMRAAVAQDVDVARMLDALACLVPELRRLWVRYLLGAIDTLDSIVITAKRFKSPTATILAPKVDA